MLNKIHKLIREQREKHIKTVLLILLDILIWAFVVIPIYDMMTGTRMVVVVQAQAETTAILSPTGREVIETTPLGNGKLSTQGEAGLEEMIKQTFPEDPETALQVAKAESRLKPLAEHINNDGTHDCGLMQVNAEIHGYDCEWLKNPVNNLKAARKIYDAPSKRYGQVKWRAWATYNYAVEHNLPI